MINALQRIQHPDKLIMDLQGNVERAVTQLQGGALADAKVLQVTLPQQVGSDIALVHNLGRALKGYVVCRVSKLSGYPFLADSANASPTPNVSFLVVCSQASPASGPPTVLSVLVF